MVNVLGLIDDVLDQRQLSPDGQRFDHEWQADRGEDVERRIWRHMRRLKILEERRAELGSNAPPEMITEIEDITAEIKKLRTEL